ncbi:tumor suppressor candidate 2-like [Myxocyprinus asiaticus]|uniref:tumor suppressor candidate 2-like n=1 Tax=Myxocyprinus asiaticus TaxID=70543 RepID=UPI0022216813|nr:tumor suppressor candidate 2-like [Myxocyprinus asiaticus]
MGGNGSKSKGVWPFTGTGPGGEPPGKANEQCLALVRGSKNATPFVFTLRSSLYFDEDRDLAHELYEETVVTRNGRKKAKLKRIQKNLIPQEIIKLDYPQIHMDFPVILCKI